MMALSKDTGMNIKVDLSQATETNYSGDLVTKTTMALPEVNGTAQATRTHYSSD